MSIVAKGSPEKEFEKLPLPEPGTVQAVCCAVWDLGMQETKYTDENGKPKVQHKVMIAWEIAQKIDAPESEYHGKPYMLNKKYTLSLNEKATLRHDLESWRGKAFPEEQITNGFDLEQLYGINCLLGITHTPDGQYANVTSILPLVKGMEKLIPVRAKNEQPPKWVQEKQAQAIKSEPVVTEENPFGEEPHF